MYRDLTPIPLCAFPGGWFAKLMMRKSVVVIVKIALALWGTVSTLLGAAHLVAVDMHAAYAGWAGLFVFLAYYSVLFIGIFSFISSRIVSVLLGLSASFAVAILVLAQPSADGLGLGLTFLS